VLFLRFTLCTFNSVLIREICSYCLISAVTSFLLLFAALWHFQVTRHPGDKMKKVLPAPRLLLGLALVGLAVAYYDAHILYNGQQLWCPPPINGCNEVASSPYARIFNLPVGYFGVVYYLYMLCLAALLAYDPFSRGLRLAALIYSAIGVGFSIYFSYLQVTFIHAFCIYCLVSAITTLLLFIAAISHFRATRTLE
jgi:uncharacterized membrane protein